MHFDSSTIPGGSCSRSAIAWPISTAPAAGSVLLRPARVRGAAGQLHRDRQGRRAGAALVPSRPRVTSVRGSPVLLSWSATMFEYLMPLLVMRSYPGDPARRVVPDGGAPADRLRGHARRAVGHLRIGLQVVDRTGTINTRRSACPASALKRGLGDELVIAPYATALAVMVDPARAANLRRLAASGLGRLRLLRIGRLHRSPPAPPASPATGTVVPDALRASPRHDAGRARQRAPRRLMVRRLPCRSARAGHRVAPAGTRAAAPPDDRAAA